MSAPCQCSAWSPSLPSWQGAKVAWVIVPRSANVDVVPVNCVDCSRIHSSSLMILPSSFISSSYGSLSAIATVPEAMPSLRQS